MLRVEIDDLRAMILTTDLEALTWNDKLIWFSETDQSVYSISNLLGEIEDDLRLLSSKKAPTQRGRTSY